MKVKMETGIPIPSRRFYDDLIKMKRNKSSFVFPEAEFSNMRGAIQDVKKRYPSRKFKTISISETERRVWRKK